MLAAVSPSASISRPTLHLYVCPAGPNRTPTWCPCACADEAVAGGAAGLVYVRVKEGGQIEAAKPVMEGLSPEQQAALVQQMQVGG